PRRPRRQRAALGGQGRRRPRGQACDGRNSRLGIVKLDIFTLFPGHFEWFLEQRHVRNVLDAGSEINLVDYRDTTPLKGGRVDDTPYGGGAGMVMRVDVVDAALQGAYGPDRSGRRIAVLSPAGRLLDDALASELAGEEELTLLSGRYEGFDARVE